MVERVPPLMLSFSSQAAGLNIPYLTSWLEKFLYWKFTGFFLMFPLPQPLHTPPPPTHNQDEQLCSEANKKSFSFRLDVPNSCMSFFFKRTVSRYLVMLQRFESHLFIKGTVTWDSLEYKYLPFFVSPSVRVCCNTYILKYSYGCKFLIFFHV